MRLVYCYTVPLVHFQISLNGIIRSRFIGYNLSLLQHPFISAAKLQKKYGFWDTLFGGLRYEVRDLSYRS